MKTEKNFNPVGGYTFVAIMFVIIVALIILFSNVSQAMQDGVALQLIYVFSIFICAALTVFMLSGLVVISPNSSKVLVLFGAYKGSVKQNGLFWVNPFFRKITLSLRARNFESEKIKVNDKMGNPILISVILVWRVNDTFKATFEVDSYESFVRIQTDSAVRKLAGSFPYDHFEDERASITLSTNFDDIN